MNKRRQTICVNLRNLRQKAEYFGIFRTPKTPQLGDRHSELGEGSVRIPKRGLRSNHAT